jgi:molybdate transport system substrate-binding protein
MGRRFKSLTQLIVALLLLHVQPTLANAQELKVLCSVAFKDVLQEVAPLFELATGHRLAANYDLANRLMKRVELGEHFDVVILTSNAADDLTKSGKLIAASRRQIASVGIGVAVRKGAHKPDIRSIAELKQVLLNAKSIAYSKEGASGIYFAAVLERLGIAERVRAKTKFVTGTSVAEFVGDGGAEIGVQMISEILPVSSVVLAGPLPPELQKLTSFTAAIGTNAVSLKSANELVSFLVGPRVSAVAMSKGMQPPANPDGEKP